MTKFKITKRGQGIDPIDKYVGEQLRIFRLMQGMPQAELAERLGISFQQIQKYEKGQNRISASKLAQCAMVLGRNISEFYDYNPHTIVCEEDAELFALIKGIPKNLHKLAKSILGAMVQK